MASELRITTLANLAATESVDTTYVINGSAKAFSVINLSSGNTIRKSLNLASITDIGTGVVESNFTNAFADADYYELHMADSSFGDYTLGCGAATYSTTTKARSYNVRRDSGATLDEPKAGAFVHGDLA